MFVVMYPPPSTYNRRAESSACCRIVKFVFGDMELGEGGTIAMVTGKSRFGLCSDPMHIHHRCRYL
jgi:hypothetical protein